MLLLLTFLLSGLVAKADLGLKIFWWIVIVYSFAATIYFIARKWKFLNVIWHVSYLIIILGIMIYREEAVKPDIYFTTQFQLFILLTSLFYPRLMVLFDHLPILLKKASANQSNAENQPISSEPVPSMQDDEMKALIREVFSAFLVSSVSSFPLIHLQE